MRAVLLCCTLVVVSQAMRLAAPATLPPPLSPADGVHTFTYDSVQRRLPLIVEAVITNNPDYKPELVSSLRGLADEIAAGAPLKPLDNTQCGWPEVRASTQPDL